MAIEFSILKDLAVINNTAIELVSVDKAIRKFIVNTEFLEEYSAIMSEIVCCYHVVIEGLDPLLTIENQADFEQKFDGLFQHFIDTYLIDISRPRVHAELVYEKNLQFQKRKELKTHFPMLKRNFIRLNAIIDKWLDNDIWLAMTIDSLFKLMARLLKEIKETAEKDVDDAYLIYCGGIDHLREYLTVLVNHSNQLKISQISELQSAS